MDQHHHHRSDQAFQKTTPSLQMNFNSDRPSLMSQLKKQNNNMQTPTHFHIDQQSPFPNYREINLANNLVSSKRNAQSVEGKASSETTDAYMSLDRKSATKKQFADMPSSSSAKRENNFNKMIPSQTAIDPKNKLKSSSSQVADEPSNDKIRKATLSPPQSQKDNSS